MTAFKNRLAGIGWAVALFAALSLGSAAPAFAQAKDVLNVDLSDEPQSLDPQKHANASALFTYGNIFDRLLTRTNEGEIVGQIATAWEYLSDTEILFTIRTDAKFHDGEPLTVDDVVFSVQRITDPAYASDWISNFAPITGVEAVGDNQVKLTTAKPYPTLLTHLVKLAIVPKKYVEAVGNDEFNLKPIGSGPYKFVSRQNGVGLSLERFDDYWGTKGPFAKAEFRIVPDVSTRFADLQTGAADIAVTVTADIAQQVEANPALRVASVTSERTAYFKINVETPPFDNVKVREAVMHAIDRSAIVDGLLLGKAGVITDQLIPPASFGHATEALDLPTYDPDAARALLAEVPGATDREIVLLNRPPYDRRVVEAVQQMLIDVGFKVRLEEKDSGSWFPQVTGPVEGLPDMYFINMSCSCLDADGLYDIVLKGNFAKATGLDQATDDLLLAARSTLDSDARQADYNKVAEWMAATLPIVPMYTVNQMHGVSAKLGWQPTPAESMFINRMTWTE